MSPPGFSARTAQWTLDASHVGL